MQSAIKTSNRLAGALKTRCFSGRRKIRLKRIHLPYSSNAQARPLVLRFPHAPVFFPVAIRHVLMARSE